jgi:hypothetical protein
MYSLVRRLITFLTALAFIVSILLIWTGEIHLFASYKADSDTVNNLLYILSTIVATTGAIAGISIAMVFITLQTSARRQYARTLITLYSTPSTIVVVVSFIATILTGIYQLVRLALIVKSHDYRSVDIEVALGMFSMVFLVPLLMSQVENINPYLLAEKLCHSITPRSIRRYGLVSVSKSTGASGFRYALLTFGLYHPSHDPLGPIHEIIMGAVESKDRLQLTRLIRILLKRIAHYCGVLYTRTAQDPHDSAGKGLVNRAYMILMRPARGVTQVLITLHLLHYVVRRSHNLRKEWGDLDNVRQHFVVNLTGLIRSLNNRHGSECCIDLCLFAILHICLGYADVPRFGRIEALADLFLVASELIEKGKPQQARLAVKILAFLVRNTQQLPRQYRIQSLRQLSIELRSEYARSISVIRASSKWRPGDRTVDPWYE